MARETGFHKVRIEGSESSVCLQSLRCLAQPMTESYDLSRAQIIAELLHKGQVDKAGAPYFMHVGRVAAAMPTEYGAVVAWLHDVLEDTLTTPDMLREIGVGEYAVRDVEMLTRTSGETYFGYIRRVAKYGSDAVIAVKLADLNDHLERRSAISDSLVARYEKAQSLLMRAQAERSGLAAL